MILTCPNCGNRYLIGDHALGDEGRKVRCGNCEHTWHAMPESQEAVAESRDAYESTDSIPEAVRPVPEHSGLPAVQNNYLVLLTRSPRINGALCAVTIFLLILMPVMLSPAAAVTAWPASAWLYQTLGMSFDLPGDDLALERVKARYEQKKPDDSGKLSIDGRIINLSNEQERFDRLSAILIRKGEKEAEARKFTIGSGTLSGESQKSFSHTIDVALTQNAKLQVEIVPPWKD